MSVTSVLVDFNNLAFRSFFTKGVNGHTADPDYILWKIIVYEGIFGLLRHIDGVKELVIAVDDKNSWRKSYFSRYKERRKKNREKNKEINWEEVFKQFAIFVGELKHYMPFKVIKLKACEADDVIATIVMNVNKNFVISSNDEDYLQLSDKAKVWNPSDRKYVKCDDVDLFLTEKCLTGQSKDDIFNVKTPSDWGQTPETEGKRKPGFGPKSAQKVLKGDLDEWLEKNDLEGNFHRNQVLIDFNYIPQTLQKRIMDVYNNYTFPPPSNIYQFFKKYRMKEFLDNFTNVENTLLELY